MSEPVHLLVSRPNVRSGRATSTRPGLPVASGRIDDPQIPQTRLLSLPEAASLRHRDIEMAALALAAMELEWVFGEDRGRRESELFNNRAAIGGFVEIDHFDYGPY